MKKKTMLPVLALFASSLLAVPASGLSAAINVQGECTLKHSPSVNAAGPCTVLQEGDIMTVNGTLTDTAGTVKTPSQHFTAVINNAKNEGLLIGAGFFDLANGKLKKNESTKVVWPNGYTLTIKKK